MIVTIIDKLANTPNVGGVNTFLNPFSYLMLRKEKQLVKHFDSIMLDGQFLVRMIQIFIGKKMMRRSFDMTSLAPITFIDATEQSLTVYLIGSDENSISKAVQRLKERFPHLQICGWRNGFLCSSKERNEAVDTICQLAPAIVVVGMGTPHQEQFLVDLKEAGWSGAGYTCGGFFHQTAKKICYYPKWADEYQLRWLYRIIDEPKLFRRYTIGYSWFLIVFLYDVIKYKLHKLDINGDGPIHLQS